MTDPIPTSPTPVTSEPVRRRRWPWVVLALFLLLGIFVALLPTILSLGFMRQYLIGKVNQGLTGHLEIGDWSLGWTGCEFRDVRLFDERQAEVLSVARIRSHLSLRNLLRGRYNCGATDVEEPNFTQLVISHDGTINLQNIFPAAPRSRRGARSTPVELSGVFNITRLRATIVDRRDGAMQFIEPSTAKIAIKNLRDPVSYEIEMKIRDATTQPSPWTGRVRMGADLQTALSNGGEKTPFGSVALAGAEAVLRAAGRPIVKVPATRPTTQPATTQAETAHHRRRR